MPLPVPLKTRRRLAFLFSLPAAFSLTFFGVELLSERAVIHSLEIQNLQNSVSQLERLAKDTESAERGFLLTGDRDYLLPIDEAEHLLPSRIEVCKAFALSHPGFDSQVTEIARLVQQRIGLADNIRDTQRKESSTRPSTWKRPVIPTTL